MKRSYWILIAMLALCALVLGGCMNTNPVVVEPSASVWPAASVPPNANTGDIANAGAPGGATPFDWKANAPQVEASINQISEIADSRVVVTGNTALVAVKYTPAYRGETTERIREMVAAAVKQADPTMQTVAVTAEEKDVNEVFALADQIRGNTAPADASEQINRIVRNATTLRG